MDDVLILSYDNLYEENRLNIFKMINPQAYMSDFAIMLGGFIDSEYKYNIKKLGNYWINTDSIDEFNYAVNSKGNISHKIINKRTIGIRPILSFSQIKDNINNYKINEDGIIEIEYGEYPQHAVDNILQEELEKLYQDNILNKTWKTYTTDSRKYSEYNNGFLPLEHIEYCYNNKKYIRVKSNFCFTTRKGHLSNGEMYNNGEYIWVEVEPIKWLVDEENDIALSKDILIAGIQFNNDIQYIGNFQDSNIYKFLNTYFKKDIIEIDKLSVIKNMLKQSCSNIENNLKILENEIDIYIKLKEEYNNLSNKEKVKIKH